MPSLRDFRDFRLHSIEWPDSVKNDSIESLKVYAFEFAVMEQSLLDHIGSYIFYFC